MFKVLLAFVVAVFAIPEASSESVREGAVRRDVCKCSPNIQVSPGNPCNISWVNNAARSHKCRLMTGVLCLPDLEEPPCYVDITFKWPVTTEFSLRGEDGGCIDRGWTNGNPDPTINVQIYATGCDSTQGQTWALNSWPCGVQGGAVGCSMYAGVYCDGCTGDGEE